MNKRTSVLLTALLMSIATMVVGIYAASPKNAGLTSSVSFQHSEARIVKSGGAYVYHTYFSDAMNAVLTGETVEVLKNVAATYPGITLASKNITIKATGDADAKINMSGAIAVNSNTLTLGGGTKKLTLSRSNGAPISANGGSITVQANTSISGSTYGIQNQGSGTITVSSGTISGDYGIYNEGAGAINISGGSVSGVNYGIWNEGSGASTFSDITTTKTITATGEVGIAINNESTGKITIVTGTTIQATSTVDETYGIISNGGAIEMSGGSVSGPFCGIYNSGTGGISISGGTVSGGNGINNDGTGAINISGGSVSGEYSGIYTNGAIEMSGGSVTGVSHGIDNAGTGAITFLNGEGATDKTITATGATGRAIHNESTGKITVVTGTTIQASGTGITYGIYNNANATIEISGGEVKSTGTGANYGIYNNSTSAASFSITGGSISGVNYGIYNNNTVVISMTAGSVSGSTYGIYNKSSGAITFSDTSKTKTITATGATGRAIHNESTGKITVVTGTTIQASGTGITYGIYNNANATIEISGGAVKSTGTGANYGIYNNSTSAASFSITGGSISGVNYGIYNNNTVVISMSAGSVTGSSHGIYNKSSGPITFSNTATTKTITATGAAGRAIYNGSGNITIVAGTTIQATGGGITYGIYSYGGTVTMTGGEVKSTGTGANYGIYTESTSTTAISMSGGSISGVKYGIYNYSTGNLIFPYYNVNKFVKATGAAGTAIHNESTADITNEGGTIEASGTGFTYGIYSKGGKITQTVSGSIKATGTDKNYGIYTMYPSAASIEIYSGTVSGYYGIRHGGSKEIKISGGTVTGVSHGIYNVGPGAITFSAGNAKIVEATGAAGMGIYNYTEDTTANIKIVAGTTIQATSTTGNTYGIYSRGGNITMSGGKVQSTGTGTNYGIFTQSTSSTAISMSGGTVSGVQGGIYNILYAAITFESGTTKTITATGAGTAIYSFGGNIKIIAGTTIQATGASGTKYGIRTGDWSGNITMTGGEVKSTGGGTNYGIYTQSTSTTAISMSGGSVSGSHASIYNNSTGVITISGTGIDNTIFGGIHNAKKGRIILKGGAKINAWIQNYSDGIIELNGASTRVDKIYQNAYTLGVIPIVIDSAFNNNSTDLKIYLTDYSADVDLPNATSRNVVRVSSGNESANLKLYVFDQDDWLFGDHGARGYWTGNSGSRVYYVQASCFSADTYVTVWDEKKKKLRRKKAKNIKYTDKLLVWNFDKGCFDFANALTIQKEEKSENYYEIEFSNGSKLEIVKDHAVFNVDKNMFTPIVSDNSSYGTPIGSKVLTSDNEVVTVVGKRKVEKQIEYTNIFTKHHLNIYTNGILTSTPFNNMYPIKEMKFVKDDRGCKMPQLLDGISEEWIKGMRLDIYPDNILINGIKHFPGVSSFADYVNLKISMEKPKN